MPAQHFHVLWMLERVERIRCCRVMLLHRVEFSRDIRNDPQNTEPEIDFMIPKAALRFRVGELPQDRESTMRSRPTVLEQDRRFDRLHGGHRAPARPVNASGLRSNPTAIPTAYACSLISIRLENAARVAAVSAPAAS